MAASAVEVVNLALVSLGLQPISALADDSDRARAASRLYETTRDELLRSANWNFAQTRAELAQLMPNPEWGDLYAYQLPADCLMVLETNLDTDEPWRIEGRTLVTGAGSVSILYVARVTDPAQWDAGFTQAVVDRLAFRLSYPLTRNATLSDALFRQSEESLKRARSRDGQEGRHLKKFISTSFTKDR